MNCLCIDVRSRRERLCRVHVWRSLCDWRALRHIGTSADRSSWPWSAREGGAVVKVCLEPLEEGVDGLEIVTSVPVTLRRHSDVLVESLRIGLV